MKTLCFLFWIAQASLAFAEVPNIVFILVDDLAWSDLGCYGHTTHDTPHIDGLAKSGLRFTQAYAPAPICSASRAAILTGKTPARLHFEFVTKGHPGQQDIEAPLQSPPYTMNLPLEEETLGEALSAAGYATGFFGKWHVNQHYEGYLGWSPTHGPRQQGFPSADGRFGSHPYAYRSQKKLRRSIVPDGKFPEDELLDRAIAFIEQPRDQKFFLYLSLYYVHDPVHTRCAWLREKYQKKLPQGTAEIRASYAAMVETMDHLVGRLLQALDASPVGEETVVVLTSDNGGHPKYTSNAPLRGSKWNLYEGGIRVPLIVRWPGRIEAGSHSDALVHACDLFPTFCELAEANRSTKNRDGVSFAKVLKNPSAKIERHLPLVWHFPYYHPETGFGKAPKSIGVADFATSQTRPHSAIRDDRWKLLHFYEDDRVELFDLSKDISEQENLADANRNIARRLKTELSEYLQRVDARFPKKR